MKIFNFRIHRKEQWDLNDLKPLVCIHKTYDGGNASKRIFCLGFNGRKPHLILENPFKYKF